MTACGATKSSVVDPVAGVSTEQGSTSVTTTNGPDVGQWISADDSYGVASRAAGAPATQSSDAVNCAPSDAPCRAP